MLALEEKYPEIRRVRKTVLLGNSNAWWQVYEDAILAARGDVPVVILGESGTGKTELARTIHRLGDRAKAPYREISCAQFEHADPAFALGRIFGVGKGHGLPNVSKEGQPGLLEECDGGTLFLDDFDRLPLNVQDVLLYPLEGKPFQPGIGSGEAKSVSIKFILASNQNPELLIKKGKLQQDVLARIGARVSIPPLRERPEDIPLLVNRFLEMLAVEFNHKVETIPPKALNLLTGYPFQSGNVRELYSELRNAVGKASLEQDSVLRAGYLSRSIREYRRVPGPQLTESIPAKSTVIASDTGDNSVADVDINPVPRELVVLRKHRFQITPSEKELGLSHKSKTLSNHLRGLCIQAWVEHGGDIDRAAQYLVIDEDHPLNAKVARKIERYIKTISERTKEGTEQRMFTNLPTAFHKALSTAIGIVRKNNT